MSPEGKVDQQLFEHRSEYMSERTLLISGEQAAAEQFSKAMLALSTAALGFSLTFVNEGDLALVATEWLYVAWGAFGLALIATIRSFYCSQLAYRESREKLDDEYPIEAARLDGLLSGASVRTPEELRDNGAHPVADREREIAVYQGSALLGVITGVVSLIIFSIINL